MSSSLLLKTHGLFLIIYINEMSEDTEREKEALEWCEATLIDVVISQSVICM